MPRPTMSILKSEHIPLNKSVRPDPSIVAAIEFVEREARHYVNKGEP